jgi:hypothetical protein
MGNGTGNGGRTRDAMVDWEFERRKKSQLAFRQAGKIDQRSHPLSKRHCLIVAGFCLILGISILLIFANQKDWMMLINWGR